MAGGLSPFGSHRGGPLEQVWLDPLLDVGAYHTLYIALIELDARAMRSKSVEEREMAQRLVDAFRASLNRELQDAEIFRIVSTDPYFSLTKQGGLTLRIRLTEFSRGNPALRGLIGFGVGATQVQVEGKLIENATGRVVGEFADRRLHPGGALVWGIQTAMNSEYLIGVDLKQILDGIVKLFIYLREEGPLASQF